VLPIKGSSFRTSHSTGSPWSRWRSDSPAKPPWSAPDAPGTSAAPRPKPIASKRSWGATLPTGRSPCSRQGPDMSGSRAHHYPGTTGARRHEPRSLHHHNNPIAPLFAFPQMVDHAKGNGGERGDFCRGELVAGHGRSPRDHRGSRSGCSQCSERGRVLSAHEDTQAAPPLALPPTHGLPAPQKRLHPGFACQPSATSGMPRRSEFCSVTLA